MHFLIVFLWRQREIARIYSQWTSMDGRPVAVVVKEWIQTLPRKN